ncbi:MAG: helix-turn-helix domain-containing protein [Candidatus Omnitrophica bacterium]|nr:helix-turn-helix domain-containing protein [Candidatus Omnitrophota bacterium]
MGNKLTSIQNKLLKLLQANLDEPLSYRDLARNLDVISTNTVAYHLKKLERYGYLKRDPYNPRNYQVLGTSETGITYLNMYGLARCGPNGSLLDGNPVDRISISTRLIPCRASEAFLVKAKGDSMEPRIHSGDVVLARRQQTANDGEVVVCVNNGEVLLKKFVRNNGSPLLISLNQAYNPIVAKNDFHVEGIVKSIMYSAVKPTI